MLCSVAIGLAFGLGCASTEAPDTRRPSTEAGVATRHTDSLTNFVRSVDAFGVVADDGTAYDFPFLGGLNVPRPQFVDIDADGDLDLFVQESTNDVMFFENVGDATSPDLRWRSDRYQNLRVGEWYRFVDLDRDGDYDLLAEKPFSYVRYFINGGTARNAQFDAASSPDDNVLVDDQGEPVFSDRQNIPSLADLDCNDRLDLFIGRVDGTIWRYEEKGVDANGMPRFQKIEERFEDIEIIGEGAGSMGTRHGANTMAFADFDADGDLDLFWGDFFERGVLLIENTGSCRQPVLQNEPVSFPRVDPLSTSGYNAPVFADIDGAGSPELFVGVLGGAFNPNHTTADNLYMLQRPTGGGTYATQTRRWLSGIDVGSESIPVPADLDDDGDLDLLVSNKIEPTDNTRSYIYVFRNDGAEGEASTAGSHNSGSFHLSDTLKSFEAFHKAPAMGDLDGDGDLDMLVGTWTKGIALFRNTGGATAATFELETSGFVKLTRGSNATPALVDIDADGDLDLFVGESSGTINFYRNEGTPSEPSFELVSDEYGDFDVGRRSIPTFWDLDGDGDWDMIVGRDKGPPLIFRNTGSIRQPTFVEQGALNVPVPDFGAPAFADLDGDGDADLLVGTVRGGVMYFERR